MERTYITSYPQIAALAALGIFGNLSVFILPVIVGGVVDDLGLSVQQGGFVASADLAGIGLGAYVWSRLILKSEWRKVTLWAIALSVVGNGLSALAGDANSLMAARVVAGAGSGVFLASGNSGLAMTRYPERTIGVIGIVALLTAAALIYIFSQLRQEFGVQAVFISMGIIVLLLAAAAMIMPERAPASAKADQAKGPKALSLLDALRTPVFGLALGAVFLFFMGAINFWVYIERVGVSAGFTPDAIAAALSFNQLAGATGSLLAATLGTRLGGRLPPICVLIGCAALSALLIAVGPTYQTFTIAAFGLGFAWTGFYPYLMGTLISLDGTGQLVAHSLAVQTFGKIIGPIFVSTLITGNGFAIAYWCGFALFAASFLGFLPGVLAADRSLKANAESGRISVS